MSQWTDALKSHAIWNTMEALGPSVDEALKRPEIPPDTTETLVRVGAVLQLVGKRLAGVDAHTVPFAFLGQLATHLANANNEVRNFVANGNPGHVTNANAHADNALTVLPLVSVPASTEDFVGAKEAAERYRTALSTALAEAKASSEKTEAGEAALRTRLTELVNDVAAEKQRLTNLTSDQQAQFSTAQDARSRDWAAAENGRAEKSTTLIATLTKQLADQASEFIKAQEAARKEHSDALAALRNEFVTKAASVHEEMEGHRSKVESLLERRSG